MSNRLDDPILVEAVTAACEQFAHQGYPCIPENIRVYLEDRGITGDVTDSTINQIVVRWFAAQGLGPSTRLKDIPDHRDPDRN
jgi:hypothetical protein